MNKPFTSCFVALITALIARPAVSGANTAGQIPLWPKGAPCEKADIGEDRDGFAREKPIMLSRQMNEFAFTLESRSPQRHETALTIAGFALPMYPAYLALKDKKGRHCSLAHIGRSRRLFSNIWQPICRVANKATDALPSRRTVLSAFQNLPSRRAGVSPAPYGDCRMALRRGLMLTGG